MNLASNSLKTTAPTGLFGYDSTSDQYPSNYSPSGLPLSDAAISALAGKAPLASPAFTGNPTAPTQSPGNNTTRLATTAFVKAAIDAIDTGTLSAFLTAFSDGYITVESQSGANDHEKFMAACAAAVAAGLPVILTRVYRTDYCNFNENYNGLTIYGLGPHTGIKLVDSPSNGWARGLRFHPASGQELKVHLKDFSVDGNRKHASVIAAIGGNTSNTHWGIEVGGDTNGLPEVTLENMYIHSWDQSGFVMWGSKAKTFMKGTCKFRYMGLSGLDLTNGTLFFETIDTGYNAGVQANFSAAQYVYGSMLRAHNGARAYGSLTGKSEITANGIGGGVKISISSGRNVVVQIDTAIIEDNMGVGLSSTSSGIYGHFKIGNLMLRNNASGAINCTDGASITVGTCTIEKSFNEYNSGSAIANMYWSNSGVDVYLTGLSGTEAPCRARFGTLDIKDSSATSYAIAGGWGMSLNAKAIYVENNASGVSYFTWQKGSSTGSAHTYLSVDELVTKGAGSDGGTVDTTNSGTPTIRYHLV